jgi:aminoglycoside 3-N-acetyltransferase
MLKQLALRYAPNFLLEWVKRLKKNRRRKHLAGQEKKGMAVSREKLARDLRALGLKENDSVLVHSSLSKIGYLKNGPLDVINALSDVVGSGGTLLFPTFPASGRNKDHLEEHPYFDILKTPSRMGSITEYFRKMEGVKRSFHPTDPVCAKGPLAEYYTNSHYGQMTPYNRDSPFRKLCEKKGRILMLGTTLNGACTNLHTLEDAVDFKYPVYDRKIYDVKMTDENGNSSVVQTKVHNPEYSAKRNCDALKPIFERENVLKNGMIGEAASMLIDADGMLRVMIKYYNEKGVTMYTPYGDRQ